MSAWIPLMDYAIKKGVSISTLRRYIKSNKIKYRTEAGKYLLWDDEMGAQFITGASDFSASPHRGSPAALLMPSFGSSSSDVSNQSSNQFQNQFQNQSTSLSEERVRILETKLQKAQSEIAELKMLVSLYEDQLQPKNSAR